MMRITAQDCQVPAGTPAPDALQFSSLPGIINNLSAEFAVNCATAQRAGVEVPADSPGFANLPKKDWEKYYDKEREILKFPLSEAGTFDFLRHCPDRQLRQNCFERYTSVKRYDTSYNNLALVEKLCSLRRKWADTQGYRDFYSSVIQERMIKNPAVIDELLARLHAQIVPRFKKNYERIAALAQKYLQIDDFKPWDLNYTLRNYGNHLDKADAPFFSEFYELKHVKKFMLNYMEDLFDLSFKPMDGKASPDYYLIYDRRAEKYLAALKFGNGDPTNDYEISAETSVWWKPPTAAQEKFQLPIIRANCNFMCPPENKLVFLDLNELQSLFHEMGHVIEMVFMPQNAQSGIPNMHDEADLTEFASYFMEDLVSDEEFLRKMSRHYLVGFKLPPRIIRRRLERDEFFSAFSNARDLGISMKERELHRSSNTSDVATTFAAVDEMVYGTTQWKEENLLYETNPALFAPKPKLSHYFCNRVSYFIGRLLARSVFEKFKDNKSLFRKGIGKKLREEIFTQRGRRSFFDSYCAFTGRSELELDIENLGRHPAPRKKTFWRSR